MAIRPMICYLQQNKRKRPIPLPNSNSPLRYPGSKRCLYPLIWRILRQNKLERRQYAEPYAGGAGLAIELLYGGHVSDIHINDIDASIWAFWHSVLIHTEEFAERIRQTPITVDEWHFQRNVHMKKDAADPVSLGFAAFFLNRTNRSGILKAGVIGGQNQSGRYKLDCRFNRVTLERRVRRIAKYRDRIHLSCQDALDFISQKCRQLSAATFFCVDPPYLNKGHGLYTNFYTEDDHVRLAKSILDLKNPWMVTYDNTAMISKLYRDRRQYHFDINYSVQTKRRGTELMIVSKGLRLPLEIRERQVNKPRSGAKSNQIRKQKN